MLTRRSRWYGPCVLLRKSRKFGKVEERCSACGSKVVLLLVAASGTAGGATGDGRAKGESHASSFSGKALKP